MKKQMSQELTLTTLPLETIPSHQTLQDFVLKMNARVYAFPEETLPGKRGRIRLILFKEM